MQCCWLQTAMQLPRALPKCHRDVSWHNISAKYQLKGSRGTNWPFIYCSSSDVTHSSQVCWFAQLLPSEKKLTFSLCQPRNSLCNLTSSQLVRNLREPLKKTSYLKERGGWCLIKLLEICTFMQAFSVASIRWCLLPTPHMFLSISQAVPDVQHCFPLSWK